MENLENLQQLNAVKGIKIVHLNVRSLPKKMDQMRVLMSESKIDVLTISETWLRPHLQQGLFTLKNYARYRLDRSNRKGKGKRGGGLVTYVHDKHSSASETLVDLNKSDDNLEVQWVLIHRAHCKNIVVGNVYRPPNGNLKTALDYLDDCLKAINMSKVNVFIMGDMNVNYKNKSSLNYKKLHFFSQSNGLSQYIKNTTRNTDKSKSLIDLALTNSKFVSKAGTLDLFLSDHQPIYIIHKKGKDVRDSVSFVGRSYRKFDRKSFQDALADLNWEQYYGIRDPEEAWLFIKTEAECLLNRTCPLRSFSIKNYRPEWMSNELIEQIKDRDYFYRKAKKSGDKDAWNIAKHLRNTTNSNIRQAKKEFILDELKQNEKDPKKFWKVIREVIPSDKASTRKDIMLKDLGQKIDRSEVAHYINDFFVNVGKITFPLDTTLGQSDLPGTPRDMTNEAPSESKYDTHLAAERGSLGDLTEVCKAEVLRVVKEINISKSSGIENISSFVVKELFLALLPQVTYMFNLSITSSAFPDSWKTALVIPIPKSGDLTNVKNYRPISLLPLPGKILEKLVHKQLAGHLEGKSLLIDEQHGFRKNHSTVHSVAQLANYVNTKMDSQMCTVAAYIDFRKAFDCVQHSVLITKLVKLNFDESVVDWVRSYLTGRSQKVLANDTCSSLLPITQGVPQGSVLGPLFYIVYANDLTDTVKNCMIALYADDTVLFTANKSFERSVSKLRSDLDALSGWCKTNGIMDNTDKSKVMVFGSSVSLSKLPSFEVSVNNVRLQNVTSYKYLGITLDQNLNYGLHVNKIISSVSGKLKQFQRMRGFLSIKAAILMYKGTILPLLEYGDLFLNAASLYNRKKLQVLQNKCLRCALNKGIETSSEELHEEASLLKLKYRREEHILNFMYDWSLDVKKLKAKRVEGVNTRSSSKKLLRTKKPITERFKRSLSYFGPRKWNALSSELQLAPNKGNFKSLIRNWVRGKAKGLNQTIAS